MGTRISSSKHAAVIGGGPAGLMAAEIIASAGVSVTLFEKMPSVGRKFLMAGRGGLNLTHSEPMAGFLARYGDAAAWMAPLLAAFPPASLIDWCHGLDQPTFVGSSGRVFPRAMKASPLLRAWLRRLDALGVKFKLGAQWSGWSKDGLCFADGTTHPADAVVLALGGASWPRLGADGGWLDLLPGIEIAPLRPANCGFVVQWSSMFCDRHAGTPLKRVRLTLGDQTVQGEAMVTAQGIEGGAIYALAARARETIAAEGCAEVRIDLCPDITEELLARRLDEPRGSVSLSNFLRKRVGLSPVAVGLVQEALHGGDARPLGVMLKSLPLRLIAPFGLARAISTAGGIARTELDEHLMLKSRPGVFAAGEMLDWEAPTGGYLLQACMASGVVAGQGAVRWLNLGVS